MRAPKRSRAQLTCPIGRRSINSLDEVRRALGPVEIMVTSAAIATFVPFTEITREQWDRMLAVDLTGTFHCLQAAIPDMLSVGWGRIVTIASSAGQIGSIRQAHYAAAKGGVIALTKTVAREFGGHGITANTIPPFCVDTPMLRAAQAAGDVPPPRLSLRASPLARIGTGDDIAAACAFLCSEARATSPARSSVSTAVRCCERRRVGRDAQASVPFRRPGDGSRDRFGVARRRPPDRGLRLLDPVRRRPLPRPRTRVRPQQPPAAEPRSHRGDGDGGRGHGAAPDRLPGVLRGLPRSCRARGGDRHARPALRRQGRGRTRSRLPRRRVRRDGDSVRAGWPARRQVGRGGEPPQGPLVGRADRRERRSRDRSVAIRVCPVRCNVPTRRS